MIVWEGCLVWEPVEGAWSVGIWAGKRVLRWRVCFAARWVRSPFESCVVDGVVRV